MYRTRIAPSPTGDMHLGTARTAYFNWLVAKASGGELILRIDDTDIGRSDESKIRDIYTVMGWLSLDYSLLVRQSYRFDRYRQVASALVDDGFATKQDDGATLLSLEDYWKLACGETWKDEISDKIKITDDDFKYVSTMPIIKSDGSPTYNFASVVDDIDFEINYVIRGVDHLKNTSKQVILYCVLRILQAHSRELFDVAIVLPKYAHVGLLFKDNKKLAKRDGAASMISYMDSGIDPEAMLNFLLRLGWGPTVDDKYTAVIPRDKAIQLFLDGGNMRNSPANIDLQKLKSFDRKYKGRKSQQ